MIDVRKYYAYEIQIMMENGYWRTDTRYYMVEKDLNDFDLKDIPEKRRGAKLIYAP